ncbi:helix-turn-helix domain-containing protein [Gordonia phthalatica]|uniref:XRE family transcriptional regulator n=1 Tax=Gordonia phthalatica TaxID=1136941 RepID=A0A0N9N1M7_9ACTN|nr:helix-turn-helix transcriptional regulator [Gordonia phthalatica]ALG84028.1 XRE family transcriptional regulator [Gordonia phthalatica]
MPTSDHGSLEWDTYAFAFGHRLVTLRKARGLSQEQVAERSGLHRNAVSNLERAVSNSKSGLANPELSTVYRLARALDVPPVYLIPGANTRILDRAAEQESNQSLSDLERQLRGLISGELPDSVSGAGLREPDWIIERG